LDNNPQLAVCITTIDMKKEEKKVNTSTGSLFNRVIGYSYQQVVSEFVKVTTIKVASEKVTNMVDTFLKVEG
jgi:hypothetical protein